MKDILWISFELIINALQSGLVVYYLSNMFTVRRDRRWLLILCGALFFACLTAYIFVDIPFLDTWVFLIPTISTLFLCRESLFEKVFWNLVLMAIFSGITTLGIHLGLRILSVNTDVLVEQTPYRIFTVLLCNTLLALSIFSLTRLKHREVLSATPLFLFSTITFACAILIDILFINYSGDNSYIALKFFGSILVVLVVLLTIILYVLLSRSAERELQATRKAAALETETRRVQELQQIYDSLHGLRHDINNHLHVVQALISHGHVKESTDYIAKIEDSLFSLFSTKCLVLDSLLTLKELEMKKHGIRFVHDLCNCDNLSISDFDLCSVIGNLLDNAVEAIMRDNVPSDERIISLTICHVRRMLYIECKNPAKAEFVHKRNGRFLSSKAEAGHGRGIQNITTIVNRLHGFTSFDCSNNEFIAFIAFPHDKGEAS